MQSCARHGHGVLPDREELAVFLDNDDASGGHAALLPSVCVGAQASDSYAPLGNSSINSIVRTLTVQTRRSSSITRSLWSANR